MPFPGPPVSATARTLVQALAGDLPALAGLAAERGGEGALAHRLGPALALACRAAGIAVPEGWRQALQGSAIQHLRLGRHLQQVAIVLGEAGVPWLPIKGMDLASRVYARAEERPTNDLDVLVPGRALGAARRALVDAGWRGLASGPRYERFLAAEAYCWQAEAGDGAMLELHYRLWGMVPEGLAEAVVESGLAASELGPTGRRPTLPHAYLLAAVHLWMNPSPRPLLNLFDLERIANRAAETLAAEVAGCARQFHLQLPVGLAAAQASALWPGPMHAAIGRELFAQLRGPERVLQRRLVARGSDAISLAALTASRALARRPGRSGARAVWRRVWAHPGVVERATPASWAWPARRLWHLLDSCGAKGLAQRFAARMAPKRV